MSWDSSGILKFDLQTPTGDLTIFHMILSELTGAVPNTRVASVEFATDNPEFRLTFGVTRHLPIISQHGQMLLWSVAQGFSSPRFKVCRFSCKLLSVSS